MADLSFFADDEDRIAVVRFVLEQTDARVFELYSALEQPLREFRSAEEVRAAFEWFDTAGRDPISMHLALWSPSVMQDLEIRRIELQASTGASHRFTIEGGALISLYFGERRGDVLTVSWLAHNSEKRAAKWGVADGIDWSALKKISNRVQYQVRSRLAVAKTKSCYVLPGALALSQNGGALKFSLQAPWQYEAPTLLTKSGKA